MACDKNNYAGTGECDDSERGARKRRPDELFGERTRRWRDLHRACLRGAARRDRNRCSTSARQHSGDPEGTAARGESVGVWRLVATLPNQILAGRLRELWRGADENHPQLVVLVTA